MITYKQIEPDYIQTHEMHDDGSHTSGLIRRYETRTRAVDSETNQTYSPWDELLASTEVVEMLDVAAWKVDKKAKSDKEAFKSSRQALLDAATVTVNGFTFDTDEVSISRLANALLATSAEADTFVLQWSLADTGTGVMTDVTREDIKQAHMLAVLHMSQIWSI